MISSVFNRAVSSLAIFVICVAGCSMEPEPEAEKPSGPAAELIGSWQLISIDGKSKGDRGFKMKDVVYKFTEERMVMRIDGVPLVTGKYNLDTSQDPFLLTIHPSLGDKKEVVHRLTLSGDKVTLKTSDHEEVLERIPD